MSTDRKDDYECDQSVIDFANATEKQILDAFLSCLQQQDTIIEPTVKKAVPKKKIAKDSVFLVYEKKADVDDSEKKQAWTHPDWNLNKNTQEYTAIEFRELLINALSTATVDFANSARKQLTIKFEINGESFVLDVKNIFVKNQLNKTLKDNFQQLGELARKDRTIASEAKKLELLKDDRRKKILRIIEKMGCKK